MQDKGAGNRPKPKAFTVKADSCESNGKREIMAKSIRELLPDGKIIGFQWNNKWFGDPADAPAAATAVPSAAPSVRSEGSDEYDIHLYLTKINWDDASPAYVSLGAYATDFYTTPLFEKIAMFVPDYVDLGTGTDTHQATLMDVIIYAQDPTPTQADPPNPAWTDPKITNITFTATSTTSDTQPQKNSIPDWLRGFQFYVDDYFPTSVIDGPYTDDDGTYVNYTGSDWLYFIGTPKSRPFAYSGTHGSAYPKLRLDEFCVGAVPCVESTEGVFDKRNFTLSYETRTDKIYFRTETVDGETVHTLIRPDDFK